MKFAHTFTYRGFIVAVIYRDDNDSDAAAMHVPRKWDKVRCESCSDMD